MILDPKSLRTEKHLWLGNWIWSVSFAYIPTVRRCLALYNYPRPLYKLPLNQLPGKMGQGIHTFSSLGSSLWSCDQVGFHPVEEQWGKLKNNHSLLRAMKGTSQSIWKSQERLLMRGWIKTKYACKCHNETQHIYAITLKLIKMYIF